MVLIMHTDKSENRCLSSNSEEERECSKIFNMHCGKGVQTVEPSITLTVHSSQGLKTADRSSP